MTVFDLVSYSKKILSSKSKIFTEKKKYYESNNLALDSSKSLKKLNWRTILKAKEAIKMTLEWYHFYFKNKKKNKDLIIKFSIKQIEDFYKLISKRKLN